MKYNEDLRIRSTGCFRKSLLTSLCQREDLPLFGKEGRGEILEANESRE